MEGDVSSDSGLKRPRAVASLCRAMEYGSREKHLVFSAWLEPEGYCGYCGMGFISILLGPSWYFLFCHQEIRGTQIWPYDVDRPK